jgi:hypothetical protein
MRPNQQRKEKMEVRPSRSQENQEICPGQQIASPGVCCLLGEVEVVRIGGQFDAPEERGTRGGFRFGPPRHVSELSHKSGRTVHMLISISISISRFYFIIFSPFLQVYQCSLSQSSSW